MAVGTATAVIGGLGAGLGALQTFQGIKNKRAAQSDLANFNRQELRNAYEDIQVSTIGADLMRGRTDRMLANLSDASSGDLRSVMSNIPRIVQAGNSANREIQADLDEQQGRREYAIAGDEVALRDMQERRDDMDLQGIGNRLNVGRQDAWNGMNAIASSGMFLANNLRSANPAMPTTTESRNIQSVSPMGTTAPIVIGSAPKAKLRPRNTTDYYFSDFNNFLSSF